MWCTLKTKKTLHTDAKRPTTHVEQHKQHAFQDKEGDDEDLSPINPIPRTGISSGCGAGSGSGSSGSIYFSISRSLKNVDKGYKIVM